MAEVAFSDSPQPQGRTDSAPLSLQIGPRMTLQLIKIQEGVGEGNVLFHSFGEDGAWGLALQGESQGAVGSPGSW